MSCLYCIQTFQPGSVHRKKGGRQTESFCSLAPLFRSGRYSTLQPVHVGGREGFPTHAPVPLLDLFNEHER